MLVKLCGAIADMIELQKKSYWSRVPNPVTSILLKRGNADIDRLMGRKSCEVKAEMVGGFYEPTSAKDCQ